MSTLAWIVASGLAMGAISLVGSVTLLLNEATQRHITHPLVAFAAGSLLGGALLHMIPEASAQTAGMAPYVSVLAGFSLFLAIEQFLHWHHCHRETADCHPPLGYLILVGDGLHNLLGGLAVGAAFVADVRVGFAAGNFLYIGASDLVPEVNRHRDLRMGALHFLAFTAGAGLLAALELALGD